MNIAFAAVGRRVELVRSFRGAQQRLNLPGRLIGIDSDPLAPALQVCDSSYILPPLDHRQFIRSLCEVCNEENIDLVFPLIDPMIHVLAENRSRIEAQGGKVVAVSAESARITGDKLLSYRFFRSLGLATPNTWLPQELDPAGAQYPLFIKPRRGSASRDAYRIRDERELIFFRDYVTDPIIQEFVPGPEITSDVVCDLRGAVLGVVSRRRIEVRSGEVAKGITVHDSAIEEGCARIAEALPAVGPITVQCLLDNGRPMFTEINARLGGGIPLAIAAGFDAPAVLLAAAAGMPTTAPSRASYRAGLHMTRYDESFFLSEEDLAIGGISLTHGFKPNVSQ